MPKIITRIEIESPIERVFDLARSIDFHIFTQSRHNEVAVSGVTSGLISAGETVTWRAKHLGFFQYLTVKITVFDRPHHLRDSLVKGAFKRFDHDHLLESKGSKTIVTNVFDYTSPFSFLGRMVDAVYLKRYMTDFFISKQKLMKNALESDQWKKYIL
jgi:ligand-binding SRPBCC domain-containing protein